MLYYTGKSYGSDEYSEYNEYNGGNNVILYLLIEALSVPITNICLSCQYVMGRSMKASLDNSSLFWSFIIVPIGISVYAMGIMRQHMTKHRLQLE